MAFVPLVPIGDPLPKLVDERTAEEQRAALGVLEQRLRDRRREVEAGWGPAYAERVHRKGKLTARERLARLTDPGTRTFEVGTFVNHGEVSTSRCFLPERSGLSIKADGGTVAIQSLIVYPLESALKK